MHKNYLRELYIFFATAYIVDAFLYANGFLYLCSDSWNQNLCTPGANEWVIRTLLYFFEGPGTAYYVAGAFGLIIGLGIVLVMRRRKMGRSVIAAPELYITLVATLLALVFLISTFSVA
jgi:hypothetical protein